MSLRFMSLHFAWLGALLAGAPPADAAAVAADTSSLFGASTIAWIVGLLSGVALMVFTTFDWRSLPALARFWLQRQRRNYGWAVLSVVSVAVLAFY